ncbi:unnamed protein product, partial [Adineta steineri]
RWIAKKTNWQLSFLRTIYILPEAINSIYSLFHELKFTKVLQSQLHYLHLVFDEPCYIYHFVLSDIVEKRISCPIMILEVTRGHQYEDSPCKDLCNVKYPLYWIRTVRLTISLQDLSDLILLLMPESLPSIEYLNVTIEHRRKDLIAERYQSIKSIKLSENDLRYRNATETKLRSFVLRQMELTDVLVLFNTLTFPLLDTLILVDVYDKSLDNLFAFQQLISPSNLPFLKHNQFRFLLRFPAKYKQEWIERYYNNGWPFNNVGFHVDERIVEQIGYSSRLDIIEGVFFVYSIPFDLWRYMRTIHNYEFFARHSAITRQNYICQNMEWLCKWTNNEIQFITSLRAIRNVKTLCCSFFGINNQPEIVINPTHANLCHHLRSLTFQFKRHVPCESLKSHLPLQLILDKSPHLFYLSVKWSVLSRCSGRYPMITYVHLRDRTRFDVNQFNIIIPKVHYLAIGGQQLVREKEMVNFVCELLIDKAHFCELILLQINKNGNVRLKPQVKENTKQAIVAKIDRLKDSTVTRLEFSYHNQLTIWLC